MTKKRIIIGVFVLIALALLILNSSGSVGEELSVSYGERITSEEFRNAYNYKVTDEATKMSFDSFSLEYPETHSALLSGTGYGVYSSNADMRVGLKNGNFIYSYVLRSDFPAQNKTAMLVRAQSPQNPKENFGELIFSDDNIVQKIPPGPWKNSYSCPFFKTFDSGCIVSEQTFILSDSSILHYIGPKFEGLEKEAAGMYLFDGEQWHLLFKSGGLHEVFVSSYGCEAYYSIEENYYKLNICDIFMKDLPPSHDKSFIDKNGSEYRVDINHSKWFSSDYASLFLINYFPGCDQIVEFMNEKPFIDFGDGESTDLRCDGGDYSRVEHDYDNPGEFDVKVYIGQSEVATKKIYIPTTHQ